METQSLKILLVDDDAEYAEVVRHHLRSFQQHHFTLQWESDANNVLRVLRSNGKIDLVLLDYFLPNTDGVKVAKQIFEDKLNIPIILLTSSKDFRIAIEAMKFGVQDYLVKEETVDTMLPRTIINVLERVRLNTQIAGAEKGKIIAEREKEAIQELIVTMCHEFNNPLAAIKISADILLRQKISDPEKDLLSRLNQNIAQLEKQIVKLRDINVAKS